jgi:hypothetical protein
VVASPSSIQIVCGWRWVAEIVVVIVTVVDDIFVFVRVGFSGDVIVAAIFAGSGEGKGLQSHGDGFVGGGG